MLGNLYGRLEFIFVKCHALIRARVHFVKHRGKKRNNTLRNILFATINIDELSQARYG